MGMSQSVVNISDAAVRRKEYKGHEQSMTPLAATLPGRSNEFEVAQGMDPGHGPNL